MAEAQVHAFKAEVTELLRLVINSLYSNRDVFLRELVSNAADALDKLRFRALSEPELMEADERLAIRIEADERAETLTISDDGIGMSRDELSELLGTIARSGSKGFLEKLKEAGAQKDAPSLIGQFGVGFYSAFLVAKRVDVVSCAAGSSEAWRWSSDAKESYVITPAERDRRGTSVILHVDAEHLGYLKADKLRELVRRWSDFVSHPIELRTAPDAEPETVNQATALWQRSPKEVSAEQYAELYRHLAHDWEPPLAHRHFKIEGTLEFSGILFVPSRPLFDLFDEEAKGAGLRLHVKRVLIMERCEELVPRWLRFVRGVVDSEDLPLNVSRELLQDSRAVKVMQKQIVRQTLDALGELAKEKPDDYLKFWRSFGAVLKEGLHFEPALAEELGKLLRFRVTGKDELVSLDAYVAAMPEGQEAIWYVTAASQRAAEQSPHIERLRARGYAVLLLSDPVDPFAMERLTEYQGKPLRDASSAKLDLESDSAATDAAKAEAAKPLLERLRSALSTQVSEVRASTRLAESPACLVVPQGGLPPQIERMLRERGQDVPRLARILEVNVDHPLVKNLDALPSDDARFGEWAELLYDQALLAEGTLPEDPARLAKRLTELMVRAAGG